jgi:uncharacterized DUF497 family protein
VNQRPFQFEWDEVKADANARKLEHSEAEERWFSVGCANNGTALSIVYLWSDADPAAIKIRLISARRSTQAEEAQYPEGL